MRGLVPRQGLQQLAGASHRERQHQPVGLCESQGPFGRLICRALVTERTIGQPGQQLSLHHRDGPDDRCRAVQDVPQRAERPGRVAFGEADRRVGVADFTRAGLLVIERRERGAGFGGHLEAGLGGQ